MWDYSDEDVLEALKAAGVDDWEGCEYAMDGLPDDYTDSELVAALYAAGVDNWEGYEDAREIFEGKA